MHVQIVNFNLKDMTDAGFRSMANEVARPSRACPDCSARSGSRTSARTLKHPATN